MLTKFEARGYRNLDTEVDLGRLNVLVGPNNSGKSNLLRAIRFLWDGMRNPGPDKTWGPAIRLHSGRDFVSWSLLESGSPFQYRLPVTLRWSLQKWNMALSYALFLDGLTTMDPQVVKEIVQTSDTLITWNADGTTVKPDTGDSTLYPGVCRPALGRYDKIDRDLELNIGWMSVSGVVLGSLTCQHHRMAEYSTPALVLPTRSAEPAAELVARDSNLANHLKHLDQVTGPGLVEITDHLAELVPGLKRIIVKDADGQALWVEAYLDGRTVKLRDLSDGTIMALVLATLLFSPQKSSLLMLDEPELNLHPAWLKVVASWFQRATAPEQVILSTHSPDLLDAFTEGFKAGEIHLLVSGVEGGVQRVTPGDLADKLDEGWELGDLYRVGAPELGGWPW